MKLIGLESVINKDSCTRCRYPVLMGVGGLKLHIAELFVLHSIIYSPAMQYISRTIFEYAREIFAESNNNNNIIVLFMRLFNNTDCRRAVLPLIHNKP